MSGSNRYILWRRRGSAFFALVVLGALVASCGTHSGPVSHATGSPVWLAPADAAARDTTHATGGDWLAFGYDPARRGVNPAASAISPATVAGLQRRWQISLPAVADSSPILLHALAMPGGGSADVLYVTTRDGRLLALDAADGHTLWSAKPSGPKITHSSPVADPTHHYVYAYGLDGALHRYEAASGAETVGAGWPVTVTRMRQSEKESSALNLAQGRIYITTSGYIGDAPPYQGHVLAVDATSGASQIFNSLCADINHLLDTHDCSSEQSGIWSRGGAVVDPITGNIFVTTGNGPYTGDQGGHNWGDSVLELSGDGLRLLDSYTPDTYQQLDDTDTDLGSAAPALLPPVPASKTPYLLVQGGKDHTLRLLNRQNLSGGGGPGHTAGEVQVLDAPTCNTFTQPAVWTDPQSDTPWVFVAGTCGLGGYQVVTDAAGKTTLHLAWKSAAVTTSPVLAGGILFGAASQNLEAFNPRTGSLLWQSTQPSAGGTIGAIHWESPIVVGDMVYISDEAGHLSAYARG